MLMRCERKNQGLFFRLERYCFRSMSKFFRSPLGVARSERPPLLTLYVVRGAIVHVVHMSDPPLTGGVKGSREGGGLERL